MGSSGFHEGYELPTGQGTVHQALEQLQVILRQGNTLKEVWSAAWHRSKRDPVADIKHTVAMPGRMGTLLL